MSTQPTRYDVNCSILFTELPVLDRPAAAAAAGFDAVEFWWPFETAVPPAADVDRFARAVEDAGVALVGLNFFAGDMPAGDRGLVSWPARSAEFRDNIEVTLALGERLGCRAFNALYGNRVDDASPQEQDDLGAENLALAADAAARNDAMVLVEPVSGAPRYPLLTAADAIAVMDRVQRDSGAGALRLLLDLYHLSVNGDDLDATIATYADRIGHVQIADAPGRNQPGTGDLEIDRYLQAVTAAGYDGYVGLEYKPTGASSESFGWLPPALRRTDPATRPVPGRQPGEHREPTEPTSTARTDRPDKEHTMTTVAFIGLGIMGAPMAGHLLDAGFDVVAVNRTPEKVAQFVQRGGRGAEAIADAVKDADVIAVMVPDSPDVQAVLTGDGGVFEHARAGALIIDFSSIRPDVDADLAAQASKRGLRMLDAPVSGGEAGAVAGTLSIMVGGEAADFAAASPVFDAVGKTIVHVGGSGAGQTVKAANQLIVAGNIQLLAEAVAFLEAYGVDTAAALTVLGGGLAGSKVLDQKGQNMLTRSFAPGFRAELHHKDLGIVTAAAREAGVVIPLGAVVAQLMASLVAVGDGGLDHSALLRGVLRLSGEDDQVPPTAASAD